MALTGNPIMVVTRAATFAMCLYATAAQAEGLTAEEKDVFVENNMIHIFLHETGHALIDQFQLPVVGQEEDAVDAFATFEAMHLFDTPEGLLLDTAEAMLIMDDMAAGERDIADYFGTHDLDIQRGLRIVCHLYGLDPERYGEVADQFNMPDDRRDSCEDDAGLADDSWAALLEPHLLPEGAPLKPINVTVDQGVLTDQHRRILVDGGVQAMMEDYLRQSYDWPEPVTLIIGECGEPNAYYDPLDVSVTMCTEMIDFLFEVADAY